MSKLYPLQVTAPGFFGVNKQKQVTGDVHWADEAVNCVIDGNGRLASRKGRETLTGTPIAGTPSVRTVFEQVTSDGTVTVLSAAGNKLYSGTGTLTDITGTATSGTGVTADHWQMQNINDKVVAFQDGHDPIVRTTGNFALLQQSITAWTAATATTVGTVRRATAGNLTLYFHCTSISGTGTTGGAEPAWNTTIGGTTTDNAGANQVVWTTRKMPNGNVCHSAFGRIWVTSDGDDSVIEFSDTLLPHIFRGGAAGTIDLKTVWGGDHVTAISSIEDYLVIFGKNNILIYGGAEVPSSMSLSDRIIGTGCIARDSVASTGNDLVFLSNSGVRLMSRAIEAGGRQSLGDLSANVRNDMMNSVAAETASLIKSSYHEADGFYVLSLTGVGTDYVFDMRYPNEDGTAKVTTWVGMGMKSVCSSRDRYMYIGGSGIVSRYSGYLDGSSTYQMRYRSAWTDFGALDQSVSGLFKIPKILVARILTNYNYQVSFFIGYDFSDSLYSIDSISLGAFSASEWAVSEWAIAEWSGGDSFANIRTYPLGHGQVVKFGFNVTVNGSPISFQEIMLGSKLGRAAY